MLCYLPLNQAAMYTFAANALFILLTTEFMDRIGGPKDVTWLAPHQKLYYSARAAASGFKATTEMNGALKAGTALVTIFVGFVVYKFPSKL
ncbi:hypothetical protein CI238_05207, partial [Colletotrichum incanum]